MINSVLLSYIQHALPVRLKALESYLSIKIAIACYVKSKKCNIHVPSGCCKDIHQKAEVCIRQQPFFLDLQQNILMSNQMCYQCIVCDTLNTSFAYFNMKTIIREAYQPYSICYVALGSPQLHTIWSIGYQYQILWNNSPHLKLRCHG